MGRVASILYSAGFCLFLAGCGTIESQPITPHSSLSREEAKDLALTMARKLKGGHISAVRDTGSMLPMFHSNAYLILEEPEYEELKPGDIVIYKSEKGHLIVHQIVAQTSQGYMVKGVNNIKRDQELVTPHNLTSRVAAILYFDQNQPNAARRPVRSERLPELELRIAADREDKAKIDNGPPPAKAGKV